MPRTKRGMFYFWVDILFSFLYNLFRNRENALCETQVSF